MSEKYLDKDGLQYTLSKMNSVMDTKIKTVNEKIEFYKGYEIQDHFYISKPAAYSTNIAVESCAIIPTISIDLSEYDDINLTLNICIDYHRSFSAKVGNDSSSIYNNEVVEKTLFFAKHGDYTGFSTSKSITNSSAVLIDRFKGDNDTNTCTHGCILRADPTKKFKIDIFVFDCVFGKNIIGSYANLIRSCEYHHIFYNITQQSISPNINANYELISLDPIFSSKVPSSTSTRSDIDIGEKASEWFSSSTYPNILIC